ncbi:MAG: hypothetical protein LW869_02570 [Actinobacteria bacterium]|nr:hypothetical protein [Actinomycetota bacterium]
MSEELVVFSICAYQVLLIGLFDNSDLVRRFHWRYAAWAKTIRSLRVALEREVAALSSQARASAVVLVVAPVVFAAAASMVDGRILDLLLGEPIGWACLGLGLGLDALGAVWMTRLIGRHQ